MKKIVIHSPEDIKVGKLYINSYFGDSVLYLGCKQFNKDMKYLVVVMDDDDSIGRIVIDPKDCPELKGKTFWEHGFIEQSE